MTEPEIIKNILEQVSNDIKDLIYKCEHNTLNWGITAQTFKSAITDLQRAENVFKNMPKANVIDAMNVGLDIIYNKN